MPQSIVGLFTKAPTIDNLVIPPHFETEDAAIEWLSVHVQARSLSTWGAAYLLASITTEYGDSTFARACDESGIERGTGGRLRWMGQTWPINVVKRFKNLKFKHFEVLTALMANYLEQQDEGKIQKLLEVLYLADQGEDLPNGKIRVWSSQKVFAEAMKACENQTVKPRTEGEETYAVRGQLYHDPAIPMTDGTTRPGLVLLFEDMASLDHIVKELRSRNLYGQYVSFPIRVDDTE